LPQLRKEYFASTPFLGLYETAEKGYTNNNKIDINELRNNLRDSGEENLVDLVLLKSDKDFEDFSELEAEKEIGDLLIKIKSEWSKQKRMELNRELSQAQAEKNEAKVQEIIKQIMTLGE
jgi:hypothetical protein